MSEKTHTHPFNGPLSRTTRVSRYQKGKTNLDFTEARDSEWQWHPQHLQSENHAKYPITLKSFLQAGCPSCHSTNSVKAPKAEVSENMHISPSAPSTFTLFRTNSLLGRIACPQCKDGPTVTDIHGLCAFVGRQLSCAG